MSLGPARQQGMKWELRLLQAGRRARSPISGGREQSLVEASNLRSTWRQRKGGSQVEGSDLRWKERQARVEGCNSSGEEPSLVEEAISGGK